MKCYKQKDAYLSTVIQTKFHEEDIKSSQSRNCVFHNRHSNSPSIPLLCMLQWRIQDFPLVGEGWRQPPTRALFGGNSCKNERIGSRWEGGGAPAPPALDLPMCCKDFLLLLPIKATQRTRQNLENSEIIWKRKFQECKTYRIQFTWYFSHFVIHH